MFLATHPVIGTCHVALSSLSITRGVAQAAGSKPTKDDERLVEEGMVEFMELKAGNQAAQRAAQGAKAMERPLPRRHCLAAKLPDAVLCSLRIRPTGRKNSWTSET